MKLDLEELRRLHEAATPGPWKNKRQGVISDDEGELIATLGFKARAGDDEEDNNCALIPATRNALPALLARAEVYEAAVALIAAEDLPPHTPFDGNSPEWDAKFDAEHAARKALRAALARVQEVENG